MQRSQNIDLIFEEVVNQLRSERIVVAGYIQKEIQQPAHCCSTVYVEDIASGSLQCISQALGSGSRGCRLDTAAMAAAIGTLLAQIDEKIDLLVINRFGKGETEGGGLRAAIETAVLHDIPVLVGVRDTYMQDWVAFAGESFNALPPNTDSVLQWCREALLHEARSSSDAVTDYHDYSSRLI